MKDLLNKKHVFLFQGVGVEYQNSLQMLDETQREKLHYCCSVVNKEIGLDLFNYLYNFSPTKYDKAFNDWIAIYTIDYIVYETITGLGIKPGMFLGYSMGLVTALACGKAISYELGLHLLWSSYVYNKHISRQEETMAYITGMHCEDIERLIRRNTLGNYVEIASENNEYCVVVSGIKSSVDKLMAMALTEGALKVKDINTDYAFHSKCAKTGIESYLEFVSKAHISDCTIPVISSYNQSIFNSASDIRKELAKNTSDRMYWKSAIEKLIDRGFQSFVEISLSDAITKFTKLIDNECEFITYKKIMNRK